MPPPYMLHLPTTKPHYVLLTALFAILSSASSQSHAAIPLHIESETERCSAQYYIDHPDSQDEENEEAKRDRKRLEIGIGEKFTLRLVGGPVGDTKKLNWTIEEGEELINIPELNNPWKGKEEIILEAKKNTRGGTVTIKATTAPNVVAPEPLTLEIIFPEDIKGSHINGGTPAANNIFPPDPNKTYILSVSAQLQLDIYPKSVSFINISITERDGGSIPLTWWTTLNAGHTVTAGVNGRTEIDKKNQSKGTDTIAARIACEDLYRIGIPIHVLPQEWEWKCNWITHDCEEAGCTVPPGVIDFDHPTDGDFHFLKEDGFKQRFSFSGTIPPYDEREHIQMKITISKFGCTVSGETENLNISYQ